MKILILSIKIINFLQKFKDILVKSYKCPRELNSVGIDNA